MKISDVLVGALEYIKKFRGSIFVIKFGGAAMLDSEAMDGVAQDLILLNYVGIKPVVVHGGGPEISRVMERMGKKPKFIKGLRVTDKETMDIVKSVLIGKVNSEIVASVNKHGGNAIGLSGKSGKMIVAEKTLVGDVDVGMVGKVREIHPEIIHLMIDNDYIPIISPVGFDEKEGEALNINADTVAGEISRVLKAKKFIFLTDVEGVMDKSGNLIKRLILSDVDRLVEEGIVVGGMLPKIEACKIAIDGGVERAHIISIRKHAILEEIFTSFGSGTLITREAVDD